MASRRSIIITDNGVETEYASCAAAGKDKGVHESTIQRLVKNPGAATKTGMTGRYADEAPAKPRKATRKASGAPPMDQAEMLRQADLKRVEAARLREQERHLRQQADEIDQERGRILDEADLLEQAADKIRIATEEVADLLSGSTGMKPSAAKGRAKAPTAPRPARKAPKNSAGPVVATPAAVAESAARAAAVPRSKINMTPHARAMLDSADKDDWKGEAGISAVRKDDSPSARLRPSDLAQCGILIDDEVYEDATQAADAMDWDPMDLTNALLAGDSQFEGRQISLDHPDLEEMRAVA